LKKEEWKTSTSSLSPSTKKKDRLFSKYRRLI